MIKNSKNRKNTFHETDFDHAKNYFFLVLFVYTFEMMKSFHLKHFRDVLRTSLFSLRYRVAKPL